MKKFFNTIASFFSSNKTATLEKKLREAVREDDVQKAYHLLSRGAEVNGLITIKTERYINSHEIMEETDFTCLLSIASSEPMKRLLRHFGALPLDDLKQRWDEENEKKAAEKQDERNRLEEEEKRQLAEKAAADTIFLNKVLHC